MSKQIMSELFELWNTECNLRSQIKIFRSKYLEYDTKYQSDVNLDLWLEKKKKCIPDGCPCNLCGACICQVGYIN